jgi:hypothetical protein
MKVDPSKPIRTLNDHLEAKVVFVDTEHKPPGYLVVHRDLAGYWGFSGWHTDLDREFENVPPSTRKG